MTKTKAHEVAEWLRTLSGQRDVKPVVITIGGQTFEGALYVSEFKYEGSERAVEHGRVNAGETRLRNNLYVIGEVPPKLRPNKTCMTWESNLPMDARVERNSNDWYVAGYIDAKSIMPAYEACHPFGANFVVSEWPIPTFGPYEGEPIDKYDGPYKRISLTVEYLDE